MQLEYFDPMKDFSKTNRWTVSCNESSSLHDEHNIDVYYIFIVSFWEDEQSLIMIR
jgi:hypothetical protein